MAPDKAAQAAVAADGVAEQGDTGDWRLTGREWAALAALVASFAIWAMPGPVWLATIGAVAAVALAARWPTLAVALAPLAFPLTYYPRVIGSLQIAPAEAALLVLLVALPLRFAIDLVSHRSSSSLITHHASPPRWLWLPALALLAVATLSLFTVADPDHLRESLVEYRKVIVQPLLYGALAWLALRRPRDCWLALLALLVAGAAVGLHAVAQVAFGLAGVAAEGVRRAVGVYLHPNNLALFVGRCAALGIGLALAWPTRAGRWLALALAASAAAGLLVSFSRGGWFALLATTVVLALLLGYRALAAGVAVVAAALLVGLPLTGFERLNRLLDSEAGSGALRVELWRSTLAMLADHPVTGVGLDQFLYQYNPRYVAPEAWAERFTAHPHNVALDFWVRLGLLGLGVGIAMFGVALGAANRVVRRTSGRRRALAAGAGAIICYSLLHGLVDNGFFLPDLALIFWLAVVVLARVDRTATPNRPESWLLSPGPCDLQPAPVDILSGRAVMGRGSRRWRGGDRRRRGARTR